MKIKNILLIDDDTISSWLNQAMLEKTGLVEQIDSVYDGQTAIDYLEECCSGASAATTLCPDLIFLDLNMPDVSGFDVLESIQKSASCSWLISDRIIVLTTSIHHKDLELANSYKVYDYLVKPLTDSQIDRVMDRYMLRAAGDNNAAQQQAANTCQSVTDRQPVIRTATALAAAAVSADTDENKGEKL